MIDRLDSRTSIPLWTTLDNVFDPSECAQIIALGSGLEVTDGQVDDPQSMDVIHRARRTRVGSLPYDEPYRWIYDRVLGVGMTFNAQELRFELKESEPLQFLQYEAGERYDWHIDLGNRDLARRKLSAVVQLSDPADYDGGEIDFLIGDVPTSAPRRRGCVVLFPSFVLHRVRPVTSGRRCTLAAWFRGTHPFI
jgi:PKHD-type hydroxylase